MRSFLKYFLLVLLSFHSFSKNDQKGELQLTIKNLQNLNKGKLLVLLFNEKNWAPDKPEKALKINKFDVLKKDITVKIKDIPYGTYAIGLIHDVNNNGKLDTRWIPPGMPSEDVGASNNAEGGPFGGPPWEKAKIILNKKSVTLKPIEMAHLFKD